MTAEQKRKKLIAIISAIVLLAAILFGAVSAFKKTDDAQKYQGLTLREEVEMDPATRAQIERRMAVTRAGIEAAIERGETPDLDLFVTLAFDASLLGDLVQARETYEEFFAYNAIYSPAWSNYGRILETMGDYEKALNAFSQAITLEHREADYRSLYGILTEHLEEKDAEAKALLDEAVQNIGQTPWLMVTLGKWYAKEGDCEQAIAHYEVAARLAPENESIASELSALRASCR